jgi:hypothetical protein
VSNYSIQAYNPASGAATNLLPDYVSADISFEFSDVGAITLNYPKIGLNYATLLSRCEIAILKDGVEMDDARFTVQASNGDEVKDDDITQFTGVSLLNMLKKAIVYPGTGSTTVAADQQFIGATPGGIMRALLTQNAARGATTVANRITWASFTNTTDSAGNAWLFSPGNMTYTVGVNYLDVLRNMVENGLIEVKMVGRDLQIFNVSGLGIDRTVGANPVVLRKGLDFIEAPQTRTNEQIAAVGLIQGDNNVLKQLVDSSVESSWGRDEIFISQGGVSDSTTLAFLAGRQLELASAVRAERTRKIAVHQAIFEPYTDYRVSDWVFNDSGGTLEKLRIRQLVISIDQTGTNSAAVVLNDKFLEREIVLSRQVNGILGGATFSNGPIANPVDPSDVDTTIPSNPAAAGATSAVYVNENGKSVALATVSWTAVTTNTDASTIADLDHYETEYRTDGATSATPVTALSPAREDEVLTRKFDRRNKPFGWLGGDGGASCRATSGKDFWLFADTTIGTADQSGKISGLQMVHNSVVLTDVNVPSTFSAKWQYGNRLSANDAFLESGIGNWQNDTNCSVTRDTTTSYYGTASLKVTATAPGDAIARLAAPTTTNYPVTAGSTYSVMCRAKSIGTARNVVISIRWYNASNALISTSSSTSQSGSTSYTQYVYSDVAPVLATKAAVTITFKSAGLAQVFNFDTIGLMFGDSSFGSWNDPNRNFTGVTSLVNPEDIGGTQIASGSLSNTFYWVDSVVSVGTKIYGFMNRYNLSGTYQNITHIAQWDGTTHAFEGLTLWSTSDVVQWGNATWSDASFLYVYGLDTTATPTARTQYLMRVPIGNVLSGTKEWWTGSAWTTTRASAAVVFTGFQCSIGGIAFLAGIFQAVVTHYGEGTMRRLTSSAITGAWTDTGSFFNQGEVGGGIVAYFPRIHNQLTGNDGVCMSYSVNGSVNGVGGTQNTRYYGPRFLRGPNAVIPALTPATDWSEVRTIDAGTLVDNIGNLRPNWNFQARVRAVDNSGNRSIWTNTAAIRTVDDIGAPNRPSAPLMSAAFEGVRIEWDGTDFQGGPPPADWDYLEVHLSEIADFIPSTLTQVDTLFTPLGGVSPIQGLTYNRTYYSRFVAVDVRGNKSDPSDTSSANTSQLVDTTELANKLITGAKVADQTLTVRSLTVATFDQSIVPNGGFEEQNTDINNTPLGTPAFWTATPWIFGAGATASLETTSPLAGNNSLKMVMATDADGLRYQSAVFPVTPGRLLAASMKVLASRAIANPAFEIHIVTATTEAGTGAFPSGTSIWGSSSTAVGTTAVQNVELQRIVAAGMTWARVFVTCLNAADGGGGWTGYIDEVVVQPVGGSAFIADLSVLNAKIANLAVNDAKISALSVGKLTAGTLSADMTVSARIKTANTGARVELNSAGLQAFNSGGSQTVDVAASTGAVTITGNFKTAFTGIRLEMANASDRSTIEFYGTAAVDPAFINSPTDVNGSPRLGLNSGPFLYNAVSAKHRLFLNNTGGIQLETFRVSGGNTEGGRLYLYNSGGVLHNNTNSVVNGAQFWVEDSFGKFGVYNSGTVVSELALFDNQTWYMSGKIIASDPIGGNAFIFADHWNPTLNDVYGVSYGLTTDTTLWPLMTLTHSTTTDSGARALTVPRLTTYAVSLTGFSFYVDSTSNTFQFQYWNFRRF